MPAIWTPPATWTAGQLVTANDLNTQLRDNLLWLKSPAQLVQVTTSTVTIANAVFSLLTEVNITTTGGNVLMIFFGTARLINGTGSEGALRFYVDGVGVGPLMHINENGEQCPVAMVYRAAGLSAGAHTFSIYAKDSGGSSDISFPYGYFFMAFEAM